MKHRRAARNPTLRIAQAVVAQGPRSLRYHLEPARAPGTALVTGGNKGIGAAVAAALAEQGTGVIVAAREVVEDLAPRPGRPVPPRQLRLDLGDLDGVVDAADRLSGSLADQRLDLVVLNAGVAPRTLSRSAQGHEMAFAVNVLGHHVLLERLRRAEALAEGARVVVVTGDIFVLARSCSADFWSEHPRAGAMAYARSKLGSVWLARQLADRHPTLHVVAVHPGVVRSGLGGSSRHPFWQRLTHISPERSARTVLAAACSPEVPSGSYLHNVLGLVHLEPPAPAADPDQAAAFVAMLDELAEPWILKGS